MFSSFTIGLLAGLGFAAWVYNKMRRSTGGNTQSALIVAGIAGLATLAVVMLLVSFIPS